MQGKSNMGHSKHRKSGVSPKSPKVKLRMKMEAEKNEIKQSAYKADMLESTGELFKKN